MQNVDEEKRRVEFGGERRIYVPRGGDKDTYLVSDEMSKGNRIIQCTLFYKRTE